MAYFFIFLLFLPPCKTWFSFKILPHEKRFRTEKHNWKKMSSVNLTQNYIVKSENRSVASQSDGGGGEAISRCGSTAGKWIIMRTCTSEQCKRHQFTICFSQCLTHWSPMRFTLPTSASTPNVDAQRKFSSSTLPTCASSTDPQCT